jgi:hypothetical protein
MIAGFKRYMIFILVFLCIFSVINATQLQDQFYHPDFKTSESFVRALTEENVESAKNIINQWDQERMGRQIVFDDDFSPLDLAICSKRYQFIIMLLNAGVVVGNQEITLANNSKDERVIELICRAMFKQQDPLVRAVDSVKLRMGRFFDSCKQCFGLEHIKHGYRALKEKSE